MILRSIKSGFAPKIKCFLNPCRGIALAADNASKSHGSQKMSTQNRCWNLPELKLSKLSMAVDVPKPVITRPNQVLVQVHASSVNPIDVLMADGYGNQAFEAIHVLDSCRESRISYDRFPLVTGRDFAGTVIATGAQVHDVKVGDAVWGANSPWMPGSHTDLLLTDTCHLSLAPRNLPPNQTAAIPYSALTAYSSLVVAQLNKSNAPTKRVLILGISGGLGQIASQILKSWRSHVTGVCSLSSMEQLGDQIVADCLLAYDRDMDQLNGLQKKFDVILDYRPPHARPQNAYTKALKNNYNCFYVTTSSPVLRHLDQDGLILGSAKIVCDLINLHVTAAQTGNHFRWAFYCPNTNTLNELRQMVEKGLLKAPVDKIFDFKDVPQAFEQTLSGHSRGRVVIQHN